MDKHNVLSISFDSDKLDKDLFDWSSLPEDRRILSDKICLETYGCSNKQLYNKLKAHILLGKPIDITSINESYDYSSIDRRDLIMRIGMAKSMNNDNVLTAIIYPYDPELISDSSYRDNYKEEFMDIYTRFIRLSDKYQKYSNLYSIQLFGYNVRAMYQLIYPDLVDDSNFSTEYIDSYTSTLEESITEDFIDKNIISLFKFQIMHCRDSINEGITEAIFSRMLENDITSRITQECCENSLKSSILPFFTISEFNSLLDDSDIEFDRSIDINKISNNNEYYKIITELYDKFIASGKSDKVVENTMLSIGWNPYVNPRTSMSKVRDRQIKWFNEHCAHIIDISNLNVDDIKRINESSYNMNKLYDKLDLHPVYIILSYTNTLFGNVIRKVKHCTFTHAGISLDSDLHEILSFKFAVGVANGFTLESLDKYLEVYKDAQISILCLFVDSDTMYKLQENVRYFISNKDKTKYNFKNLINILRNKAQDNDPYNLSLVCSQFVDTILKLSNIDITNKSSNLVIPQDFEDIKHPKVYKLYNGLARKYNELKLEAKIELMLKNSNPEDIKYSALVSEIESYGMSILFNKHYRIIDDDKANKILEEFYDYVLPTTKDCIRTCESNKNHEDELIF